MQSIKLERFSKFTVWDASGGTKTVLKSGSQSHWHVKRDGRGEPFVFHRDYAWLKISLIYSHALCYDGNLLHYSDFCWTIFAITATND